MRDHATNPQSLTTCHLSLSTRQVVKIIWGINHSRRLFLTGAPRLAMHTGRRWCPACGRSGSCIKLATHTDLYERPCFPPCLNLVLDGVFKFTWSPSWRLVNVLTGSPQNTWKVERVVRAGRWSLEYNRNSYEGGLALQGICLCSAMCHGCQYPSTCVLHELMGPGGERRTNLNFWSMALARINGSTRRKKTRYRISNVWNNSLNV